MGWVRLIIFVLVGWWAMKYMGITTKDLWQDAKEILSDFSRDSEALVSGEAVRKTSERLKANLPPPEPKIQAGMEDETGLGKELAEERRRVMEKKLEALNNAPGLVTKTVDVEGLKQQVLKNIQAAGGSE